MNSNERKRFLSRRELLIAAAGTGAGLLGLGILAKLASDGSSSAPETAPEKTPVASIPNPELMRAYREFLANAELQSKLKIDFTQMPNGASIDQFFSQMEGHFNSTDELAKPGNAQVFNKALELSIQHTENGVEGARLSSRDKIQVKEGLLEVTLQVPVGQDGKPIIGAFPAVWLRTLDFSRQGKSANGEIDIFEYLGIRPGTVYSTLHTLENDQKGNPNGGSIVIPDLEKGFHTFGLVWNERELIFTARKAGLPREQAAAYHRLDREKLDPSGTNWQAWPLDHEFEIIINYSENGNWSRGIAQQQNLDPQRYPNGVDVERIDGSVFRIAKIELFE